MKPTTHLRKLAEKHGIKVAEVGPGHWHLSGPLLVNYWPESKKRTAYVAGTTRSIPHCTPERAIALCFEPPVAHGRIDKRRSNSRKERERLWNRGQRTCYWCAAFVTIDDSTLEHKIPLARGGLDNRNNMTLACAECNHSRGSDMPELEEERT